MKFIIVPFKNFKSAKTRMRKDLSSQETEKIVEKMLIHVLQEVSKSQMSDENFIITNDKKAIRIASSFGIKIIEEEKQLSESVSIDFASKILKEKGATSVLRIPGDLPLLSFKDIDYIFKKAKEYNSCIVVPSKSGSGTNAMLRTPPDIIQSFFGENSLQRHIKEFEDKKVQYKILENENIGLDIDCLNDLEHFRESHPNNSKHNTFS